MLRQRRIYPGIKEDLKTKMVLLAGPRQSGKTTIAKTLLRENPGVYYNWDVDADRKKIRNSQLNEHAKLWVLDELHKYSRWRNWLKGQYDLHHENHSILVTGSANLDIYSRGGDSLQGRYFFYRLHPFTLSELLGIPTLKSLDQIPDLPVDGSKNSSTVLGDLLTLGGFPEPLFAGSKRKADRWRLGYGTRLIQDEIRSLEQIRELDRLEMLYERLPQTVGSVLSMNSLREDLEVAFETVKNWLSVFNRTYVSFTVPPFGAPRIKAVKKEQKLYLWDWARVESEPAALENLVALHLLRLVHWAADVEGDKCELRYFRDVVGHEVDFILLRKGKPWMAIEVKVSDQPLDSSLKYFLERVKVPYAYQVSLNGTKDYRAPDINGAKIRILPATTFLSNLP